MTNLEHPVAAAIVPNRTEAATVIQTLRTTAGIDWIEERHVDIVHEQIDDEIPASVLYPRRDDEDETVEDGDDEEPDPSVAVVNWRAATDAGSSAAAVTEHNTCEHLIVARIDDIDIDALRDAAENGCSIHACKDRLSLRATDDGLTDAAQQALNALTTTDIAAGELLDGVPWRGGRPPLGCTSRHGELKPADNYNDVCRVLRRVEDDDDYLDEPEAAERIGCTRSTIEAALRRGELYGLDG